MQSSEFLIPFHIFSFEKRFREIESSEDAIIELVDHYADIRLRLDQLTDAGSITEYEKHAIIDMSRRVFLAITEKHESINDKAGDVMGGEVLEFEAKKIHDEGYNEGHETGRKIGLVEGQEKGGLSKAVKIVDNLVTAEGLSLEYACRIAEISIEEYEAYKRK